MWHQSKMVVTRAHTVAHDAKRVEVEDLGDVYRVVMDLVERAHEVADEHVPGAIAGRHAAVHVGVIVATADPVGAYAAQLELPGMDVRVDQPRRDDPVAPVHHGRVGRAEVAPDVGDRIAVDQDVGALQIAQAGVDGDDGCVADEGAGHGVHLGSSVAGSGRGHRGAADVCRKGSRLLRRYKPPTAFRPAVPAHGRERNAPAAVPIALNPPAARRPCSSPNEAFRCTVAN